MTSSLVGSEMCIRDRKRGEDAKFIKDEPRAKAGSSTEDTLCRWSAMSWPVSYTHLTLPTICSV
eukprot:4827551-Prorocentrum_lima.AAC.1